MTTVVHGRMLQHTGESGWFTSDRQLLLTRYDDGWHIRPVNQSAMKALHSHGWKSNTATGLNFRDSLQLGSQLTGCTTRVIKAPARYLIVGTPLTLMRYARNQWAVTLTAGWGTPDDVWEFVLESSLNILYPTRSGAVTVINEAFELYNANHR